MTLPHEGKWEYTWSDLDKNAAGGTEISYSVKELNASDQPIAANGALDDNYTVTYSTAGGTTTITNTHNKETVDISVTKVWADNNDYDNVRPDSVKVRLYAGDEPSGEIVTLPHEGKWECERPADCGQRLAG